MSDTNRSDLLKENRRKYPETTKAIDLFREYFPNAQVKKTTEKPLL
jgi:hypothetical protein